MVAQKIPKKINVTIIVKSIDGGTGTFIDNLLKIQDGIDKSNLEIKLLVLERPTFRIKLSNRAEYFTSKNVYPKYYVFNLDNLIKFIMELLWLRKKIEKNKPNILLSIDFHSNLLAIISKIIWFNDLKIIATTHIDLYKTLINKSSKSLALLLSLLVRYLYKYANILVGSSKGVSRSLKSNFNLNKKVITIYDGISFDDTLLKPVNNFNKNNIITVTRLDEQKDVKSLIEAFYLLEKKLNNVTLRIIGDGPLMNELKLIVKKLSLEKSIIFMGWKNNIKKHLLESAVFVLSSKREGMSYALLEAMVVGLPVISTNAPYGPAEILDDGKYGMLIPVGNVGMLYKAMYKVLKNKDTYTYFAKKSINRIRVYNAVKMLNEYKYLFNKLLNS